MVLLQDTMPDCCVFSTSSGLLQMCTNFQQTCVCRRGDGGGDVVIQLTVWVLARCVSEVALVISAVSLACVARTCFFTRVLSEAQMKYVSLQRRN